MLQANKPYIFIDYNTKQACFWVRGAIGSTPGVLTNETETSDSNDPNTQIIYYTLSSDATAPVGGKFYKFDYNTNKSKISIRILNGNTLEGSVTVRLNQNLEHFYSANEDSRPFCWIKSSPVSGVKVYFKVNLIVGNQPASITELPNEHKLILYYNMANNNSGSSERSFNLEDYDPSTFELIEVHIRDNNFIRKGSGTTSQTDADSSDDN